MTPQEIIADIHALNEDLEVYERKYGVLSETFYELYQSGEEPDHEAWGFSIGLIGQGHTKFYCAGKNNIGEPSKRCSSKHHLCPM